MKKGFREGYEYAIKDSIILYGSKIADQYVTRIEDAIDILLKDVNSFAGYQTDPSILQGDIAEFWHGDTFNINAAINESNFKTVVDRSHKLASPDILLKKDGELVKEIGLKYYKTAAASVQEQSKSYFQRFCEYRNKSGCLNITMEQYLAENGISDNILETDPIYSGQIRIIPSDQYEEAINYLKIRIQKELLTRPEEVKRYQDTLNLLSKQIKASDGTNSIELSREASQELALIAKKGKFNPADYGISTEDLMTFNHALTQGVKAGTSAAIITMVLKTAPKLYQCLEKLMVDGGFNEKDLQELGFNALTGIAEGFVRGFISGTIITACETGIWGTALKGVNPCVIGALTAIMIQSMQDSFMIVKGKLTQQEFVSNLSKNVFVVSCGIGLGTAITMLTACPFAYLLGNFVGSFIGSFAYIAVDNAFMSFAISSGWTFFGIVDQNYELPDQILDEMGVDIFDYEDFVVDDFSFDTYDFSDFSFDKYTPDFISIIRRGVIGVHQIGYITA